MKKLLMPLFLILVVGVGCEQQQAITQLEVGRDKLLGAGLTIQSVENLKRAEMEERNKVEPRALLLIGYSVGLSSGDARKFKGLEEEYKKERTRRLAEMDVAQMKIILQVLNERHRVQQDAMQVLIDKGTDAVPLLVESVVKRHYVNLREGDLIDMLHQIGSAALDKVIEAVRASNTPLSVKIDFVRLIGRMGDSRAIADLESIRNTSDGALKIEINAALYKLGKKEYQKEIVLALKDPDVTARRSATKAMAEMNDSPTTEIIDVLNDADAQVRKYGAQALQNSPAKQAVDRLVNLLISDSNEDVKQAASEALHVHVQQGLAKGLANRLINELLSGKVNEPKDRVRVIHLLKKKELIKQIKAAPEDLNLEYNLYEYEKETEQNDTVKGELTRLLLELE
ncbi:HEAT repeat domain-containing protein [Candidatus Poribacteria bacterium]|nr:HEAT repeat domain-containing protein [Candidatus Poribacteria bacterium]